MDRHPNTHTNKVLQTSCPFQYKLIRIRKIFPLACLSDAPPLCPCLGLIDSPIIPTLPISRTLPKSVSDSGHLRFIPLWVSRMGHGKLLVISSLQLTSIPIVAEVLVHGVNGVNMRPAVYRKPRPDPSSRPSSDCYLCRHR